MTGLGKRNAKLLKKFSKSAAIKKISPNTPLPQVRFFTPLDGFFGGFL
jgi:hypothetical protein